MSSAVRILGIFEDQAQREFLCGLVGAECERLSIDVAIEPHITQGCRLDHLAFDLNLAAEHDGVMIGVDSGQKTANDKRDRLKAWIGRELPIWGDPSPVKPILFAIAEPSIESWMMADVDAFPTALRSEFGSHAVSTSPRPGRASSERAAKQRLGEWAQGLLGDQLLYEGREYAEQTGRATRKANVGRSRDESLWTFLHVNLAAFLAACRVAS